MNVPRSRFGADSIHADAADPNAKTDVQAVHNAFVDRTSPPIRRAIRHRRRSRFVRLDVISQTRNHLFRRRQSLSLLSISEPGGEAANARILSCSLSRNPLSSAAIDAITQTKPSQSRSGVFRHDLRARVVQMSPVFFKTAAGGSPVPLERHPRRSSRAVVARARRPRRARVREHSASTRRRQSLSIGVGDKFPIAFQHAFGETTPGNHRARARRRETRTRKHANTRTQLYSPFASARARRNRSRARVRARQCLTPGADALSVDVEFARVVVRASGVARARARCERDDDDAGRRGRCPARPRSRAR